MSKFDDVITIKLQQLTEEDAAVGTPTGQPVTPAQPVNPAQPATPQNQDQNQNQTPEQAAASLINAIANTNADANKVAQMLNTAGQGKLDYLNKVFTNMAFDPQKGFQVVQPPAQPAPPNQPASTGQAAPTQQGA